MNSGKTTALITGTGHFHSTLFPHPEQTPLRRVVKAAHNIKRPVDLTADEWPSQGEEYTISLRKFSD